MGMAPLVAHLGSVLGSFFESLDDPRIIPGEATSNVEGGQRQVWYVLICEEDGEPHQR